MDKLLTPGQIAQALQVSPRTVAKWIDSGQLQGFRLPQTGRMPGHRRVTPDALLRFARVGGVPIELLHPLCPRAVEFVAGQS